MMFSYTAGTFDLDIVEATGKFASFTGGHNRMVDMLHQLPDGSFVETLHLYYPARCIAAFCRTAHSRRSVLLRIRRRRPIG
jgi:hypothetical protein